MELRPASSGYKLVRPPEPDLVDHTAPFVCSGICSHFLSTAGASSIMQAHPTMAGLSTAQTADGSHCAYGTIKIGLKQVLGYTVLRQWLLPHLFLYYGF